MKSLIRTVIIVFLVAGVLLVGLPRLAYADSGAYVVKRGDTLWSIAARFGTTPQAIAKANGLRNLNYIYAGQRLVIPGGGGSSSSSTSTGGTYVVRRGDTLSSIAARYRTSVSALMRANGLSNGNYIYAGQRLRIPTGGGSSSPAPAPAPAPATGKRIVVDISAQRMYVYQNGTMIWNWVVSTGERGRATATGHFRVLNKIPMAWASTWSLKMPYWLGIYWAGRLQNGIHALPILPNGKILWAGYLGTPVSYGCIILSTSNAQTLYNWATVGTPVDVVW